ncbi:heme-binding protein [Photobacterium rosenbergii]|uniref:Heme-binding protein n=1 Tax=Photobacterium rosenbergii TaxID=294936 RepID=A0A2T3NLH3_9GAMM|nr:heme-binding protein [Photobacterium rosenbergii]PSW16340.1 heme-binding protein [Photobacterium rosenbergii]
MKLNIVLAATLLAASSSVLADEKVTTITQLSSAAAFELANAAVGQCAKDGYNVSATVVDISGRVQAQLRYDNASPHTLESSRQKAFTAVSMKQPTANLMKLVAEKPLMDPLRDMDDNLLFLAGGLPVEYKGQVVAAIGVGGAPGGHLDVICAEAAIKSVMK